MKKLILLIFTVVVLFGLGACSPDDPDGGKTTDANINTTLI